MELKSPAVFFFHKKSLKSYTSFRLTLYTLLPSYFQITFDDLNTFAEQKGFELLTEFRSSIAPTRPKTTLGFMMDVVDTVTLSVTRDQMRVSFFHVFQGDDRSVEV